MCGKNIIVFATDDTDVLFTVCVCVCERERERERERSNYCSSYSRQCCSLIKNYTCMRMWMDSQWIVRNLLYCIFRNSLKVAYFADRAVALPVTSFMFCPQVDHWRQMSGQMCGQGTWFPTGQLPIFINHYCNHNAACGHLCPIHRYRIHCNEF
jgi:hypothetical protein